MPEVTPKIGQVAEDNHAAWFIRLRANYRTVSSLSFLSLTQQDRSNAALDFGVKFSEITLRESKSDVNWDVKNVPIDDPGGEIREILRSGLLDRLWYLKTHSDIAAADRDPLEHFCYTGWKEHRRPNAYFDLSWYTTEAGQEAINGTNPLLHYIRKGEASGLRPAIYFDPVWYRDQYNLQSDESPLGHYLSNVESGTVSPIPEFDVGYYLTQNPDIKAAGIDPFLHFLQSGYREGRHPSAMFDVDFYARRYLGGSLTENPLIHYLARRDDPTVLTREPKGATNWARELKKFTGRSAAFEEFRPPLAHRTPRAKVLAYYLPQFYSFSENDLWWGSGFTEWTNIARGAPRFEGHYQPRIPRDLGFYNLMSSTVMHRQIEMAKAAGLFGFIFYFYWFDAHRLMEAPLDKFLADPTLNFPFCLMWANENWTRRWDGLQDDVLISQAYSDDDDDALIETWLRHFRDPRYIRIADRPVLMIYRPGIIPNAVAKFAEWRRLLVTKGELNPVMIMAQGFGDIDPNKYGLDGAIEFPPHKVAAGLDNINRQLKSLDPDFSGAVFSYESVIEYSVTEPVPSFPLIKTAVPSWDNDARRPGAGLVLQGSMPESYQGWLEQLISYANRYPFMDQPFVCINAWNEWAEGAYLEPDVHFGAAYLNATARALLSEPTQGEKKICLVGHDAHPHGAQILLQNLASVFTRQFGLEIEIVVLGKGKLIRKYKEIANTSVIIDDDELRVTFQRLFRRGFRYVIVNSAASARSIDHASMAGLHVVTLIHELPALLAEKKLIPIVTRTAPFVRKFVFPAEFVREKFLSMFQIDTGRAVNMPQGSYVSIQYSVEQRNRLRALLDIGADAPVVLGVGFADLRKGFDIFINTWRASERRQTGAHFIWVGDIEEGVEFYLGPEISIAKASGRFHTVSFSAEVAAYFSMADIYFLSSREDPFPTVVLEGLLSGIPAVAFAGSGGIPEMLKRYDAGRVVPMGDAEAVIDAVFDLYAQWPAIGRMRENRLVELGRTAFSFSNYAFNVLNFGPKTYIKISAVVPNYNYARHLRTRLGSIMAQTYPVFEIIVLDDCSTDNSLELVNEIRLEAGREFAVVANEVNSGSVFRQWRKAAELAVGDYLWIAEADDDSAADFLKRLADVIVNNEDVVLAYADSRAIDESGNELSPSYRFYYNESSPGVFDKDQVFSGTGFIRDHLSERNLILNVSGCLWKRSTLLDAFKLSEADLPFFKVAGDWLLYVRALRDSGGSVAYVAQPLNTHRRHSGSVTQSGLSAQRHVSEIQEVQATVRAIFPNDELMRKRQEEYLSQVGKQLGVVQPVDGSR